MSQKPIEQTQEQLAQRGDEDRLSRAAAGAKAARADSQREGAERSRESIPGGMRLKLSVQGELTGHHLYWANDQDGEIEQLLYEGFDFVDPKVDTQLRLQSAFVRDGDLSGNRISRYVGRREDGSPLRAYLMKCPNEIWQERENDRYKQADEWDQAVHNSAKQEGRYQYGGGISVNNGAAFRRTKKDF